MNNRCPGNVDIFDELIVDSFAGGGGASMGIERALGRPVDVAINHDDTALSMHQANHPHTRHIVEDVWNVNPLEATWGQPVGMAWFSPDCKHFSRAKGGKPVSKKIRGLAWVVVRWARLVKPRVIFLENVPEFLEWGPLGPDGRPDPDRKGETFRKWAAQIRAAGYVLEHRMLTASDYGAPTSRTRFFLIARRDGLPIRWPEPTHGEGRDHPVRCAADIIDWSIPCPSIFDTAEEIKAKFGIRAKRPLAEKTLRRIAAGVYRYAINNADPFVVSVAHGDSRGKRSYPIDAPLGTVTASANGHAVVVPQIIPRYGERDGQAPRTHDVRDPLPTIVPTANGAQLASAFLTKFNTGAVGRDAREPVPTVTAGSHIQRPGGALPLGVVAAHISHAQQGGASRDATRPIHTITASSKDQNQLVTAHLAQHNTGMVGHDARKPVSTLTSAGSHQQVVASHLMKLRGSSVVGQDARDPVPTITAGGFHVAEVRAFLLKYFGTATGQDLRDPIHTLTAKSRFALVIVNGEPYEIVDIGMRMLTPRELYLAQGFPDWYQIGSGHDGRTFTKSEQNRMCGNSVPPDLAEALVRANLLSQSELSGVAA